MWYEAGLVSQAGMGVSGLTWEEINSWANDFYYEDITEYCEVDSGVFIPINRKECTLSCWEKLMIKHLSDSYASEFSASSGGPEDRPAPYCSAVESHDRVQVAQKVNSIFQSMMSRQKQKQHYEVEEEE